MKLFPDNDGQTYDEWLAARRYRVLRNFKDARGLLRNEVLNTGLELPAA